MKTSTIIPALAICLGTALPVAAHAASFDCRKAATPVEAIICADPALSKADEEVAVLYRRLLKLDPGARQGQREWLRTVRNRCKDVACLRAVYEEHDTRLRLSLEADNEEATADAAPPARR
ncbi:lysozyme inhibitor LprI family protein [Pseudoduganella sp. SL102]|uniref:lysozyme inhibitor LprI family protein n=1 Tax=Pseudoduganella sp. SL102 TaxID=2995154 RepID=UPI00248D1CFE|nr:lysozyme inhibitor LprI family protein [Pseudoduganella sp. SL102]WBS04003.1 lysozyme inhibitor LprI family protein [Pseudoduganella sp. SL102]